MSEALVKSVPHGVRCVRESSSAVGARLVEAVLDASFANSLERQLSLTFAWSRRDKGYSHVTSRALLACSASARLTVLEGCRQYWSATPCAIMVKGSASSVSMIAAAAARAFLGNMPLDAPRHAR